MTRSFPFPTYTLTFFMCFLTGNALFAQSGPIPGGCLFVGPNLVVNPEFEEGNTGFGSSFTWRTDYTCYWGDYTIADQVIDDPATTCYDAPGFNLQTIWAVADRNEPGVGKFMIVDPCDPITQSPSDSCSAINPDGTVWSQTIPVCPNSEYTFSVFAKNIYYTEAIQYPGASQNPDFELTINGDTIAGYYVDGVLSLDGSYVLGQQSVNDSAVWIQISGRWASGVNTSATLVMKNLVEGSQGNDLAVDGIFFGLCEEDIAVDITGATAQCATQGGYNDVILTPTAQTLSSGWLYHEWYKDGTLIYSDDNPPSTLTVTAAVDGSHLGEYRLAVYRDPLGAGCVHESAVLRIEEDCDESFPVEWRTFQAVPANQQVQLYWETETEQNNEGFYVEMARPNESFASLGFVEGAGNSLTPSAYTFVTEDLPAGRYQFRLKQVDFNGNADWSSVLSVRLESRPVVIQEIFPNPLTGIGELNIEVAQSQRVRVELISSLGQRARIVHDAVLEAGSIHAIEVSGIGLAAGVYMVNIQGAAFRETQRLVIE